MQPIIDYISKTPKKKLIIRLLIISCIVVIFLIAGSVVWDNYINQKEVTLNPSPGTTIAIGELVGDEPIITKEIASTNTIKKIRLPSGTYAVKFTGSSDYRPESTTVLVDKSTEIKTPTLQYTEEKLSKLLVTEKPAILGVISQVQPNPNYQIDAESLYENGKWYGASLIPNSWYASPPSSNILPGLINEDNTQDILRVILKKDSGQWKIMAGPSIIFATDDYSKIPQSVIQATNRLGFD